MSNPNIETELFNLFNKKKGKKKPPMPINFREDYTTYYTTGGGLDTKAEADKVAKGFFEDGYAVKILDSRDGYGVYISSRGQTRRLLERAERLPNKGARGRKRRTSTRRKSTRKK